MLKAGFSFLPLCILSLCSQAQNVEMGNSKLLSKLPITGSFKVDAIYAATLLLLLHKPITYQQRVC